MTKVVASSHHLLSLVIKGHPSTHIAVDVMKIPPLVKLFLQNALEKKGQATLFPVLSQNNYRKSLILTVCVSANFQKMDGLVKKIDFHNLREIEEVQILHDLLIQFYYHQYLVLILKHLSDLLKQPEKVTNYFLFKSHKKFGSRKR